MREKKRVKKLKDLSRKAVDRKKAGQVKGGRTGPGTQTEDELYIGRK